MEIKALFPTRLPERERLLGGCLTLLDHTVFCLLIQGPLWPHGMSSESEELLSLHICGQCVLQDLRRNITSLILPVQGPPPSRVPSFSLNQWLLHPVTADIGLTLYTHVTAALSFSSRRQQPVWRKATDLLPPPFDLHDDEHPLLAGNSCTSRPTLV